MCSDETITSKLNDHIKAKSEINNLIHKVKIKMHKFQALTAKAVPLIRNDVDTDQIIPAQYLTSVSREGYGENLFRRLKDADPNFPLNQKKYKGAGILVTGYNFGCGSSREHAVWALVGAGFKVVIAESFADIFSNNSANNGLLLVTLPKDAIEYLCRRAENGDLLVTLDLEKQLVTISGERGGAQSERSNGTQPDKRSGAQSERSNGAQPDRDSGTAGDGTAPTGGATAGDDTASTRRTFSFAYDPFRKHCLLNGLDDIEYILSFKNEINEFRSQHNKNWLVSTQKSTH